MKEKEEEGGFVVQDRRRVQEGAERPRPQPPQATPEQEAKQETQAAAPPPGGESPEPPSELSFSGFVLGLGTQALMLLGELPDPQGRLARPEPAAARQLIDILGLLKEKTRGNLSQDEEKILEQLLFDLRMRYVQQEQKR